MADAPAEPDAPAAADAPAAPGPSRRTRPRLLVLFGGRSSEHRVSCVSAGGVLAQLDPARFDVTAVVGWWSRRSEVRAADPREVASVLVVPVADLTDPARRGLVRNSSGYAGPGFDVAGHLIWGLTAHLLDGVLELAGWQRPWDAERRFDIPPRYLTDRAPGRGHDAH